MCGWCSSKFTPCKIEDFHPNNSFDENFNISIQTVMPYIQDLWKRIADIMAIHWISLFNNFFKCDLDSNNRYTPDFNHWIKQNISPEFSGSQFSIFRVKVHCSWYCDPLHWFPTLLCLLHSVSVWTRMWSGEPSIGLNVGLQDFTWITTTWH